MFLFWLELDSPVQTSSRSFATGTQKKERRDAEIPAGVLCVFRVVLFCHLQLKVNVVDLVEPGACPISTQTEIIVYLMEINKIHVHILTLVKVT